MPMPMLCVCVFVCLCVERKKSARPTWTRGKQPELFSSPNIILFCCALLARAANREREKQKKNPASICVRSVCMMHVSNEIKLPRPLNGARGPTFDWISIYLCENFWIKGAGWACESRGPAHRAVHRPWTVVLVVVVDVVISQFFLSLTLFIFLIPCATPSLIMRLWWIWAVWMHPMHIHYAPRTHGLGQNSYKKKTFIMK